MQRLRGKSPQEVLGDVANSSLVQSTVTAAIAFCVVIVGLSVASHYWSKAFPDANVKAAAVQAQVEAEEATADENIPKAGAASSEPAEATVTSSGDPTLDNLGIGEAKTADPKKNPLESSLDNLLDAAK
jgi:preprotein translocase subunit SecG